MSKLLNLCETLLTFLACASTLLLMCLTTADALGRYIFNTPVIWAYEITETYLMPAVVFLGICSAYRGGAYIRVTFFVQYLPDRMKIPLQYFVQLFSILLSVVLLIATVQHTIETMASGVTTSGMVAKIGPAYLIISVGLFFAALLMVLDLRRVKSRKSDLFKGDSLTS